MNTAKQAMENMEYVRRLLEEKQAGFAASVELAVSVIRRQIERPEENDGTDAVAWTPRDHREARPGARVARGPAGAPWHPLTVAEAAAGHVDWHQMAALVQRGCPPWLALRILR